MDATNVRVNEAGGPRNRGGLAGVFEPEGFAGGERA